MKVVDIQDSIIKYFRPCCVVFPSPLASSMCADNNLSPAEFLKPFFDLRREYVHFDEIVLRDFMMNAYDYRDYLSTQEIQYNQRRDVLLANHPALNLEKVI